MMHQLKVLLAHRGRVFTTKATLQRRANIPLPALVSTSTDIPESVHPRGTYLQYIPQDLGSEFKQLHQGL